MSKHKLDLHDIYNKGTQIDEALREPTCRTGRAMDFCIDRRIDMLEIIPGLAYAPSARPDQRFGERGWAAGS
jgi:hypothetical protein